jgi:DNA helicase TIP49 (TBP-interacting protein)
MITVLINLAWMVAILVIISLFATYFFMDDFQKSYNFIIFNKKNIMVRYIRKYLDYFQNANKTSSLRDYSQFEYNNLIIHMLHKENDVIVTDIHWVVLLFSENKQSKQIYKLLIEKYPELKK